MLRLCHAVSPLATLGSFSNIQPFLLNWTFIFSGEDSHETSVPFWKYYLKYVYVYIHTCAHTCARSHGHLRDGCKNNTRKQLGRRTRVASSLPASTHNISEYTPPGREEFVRQCERTCACKRDIKAHNNAVNSWSSHSISESKGQTHHISISGYEQTLAHIVLTVLFTMLETFYLRQFRENECTGFQCSISTVNCVVFLQYQHVTGRIFLDLSVREKSSIVSLMFARKPGALAPIAEV